MTYTNPTIGELPPVFLTTLHMMAWKSSRGVTSVPSSATWTLTNRIIYTPFYLSQGQTVYRLFWLNGSTVGTNNLQAGVYDSSFNRLIAGTSTLSAGASVCQFDDITDTYLGPGSYYMALWCNGTTATVTRLFVVNNHVGGYYETNASGLPTTGTPADSGSANGAIVPVCGLALRATDP